MEEAFRATVFLKIRPLVRSFFILFSCHGASHLFEQDDYRRNRLMFLKFRPLSSSLHGKRGFVKSCTSLDANIFL